VILFAATVFTSAFLLFLVQPVIAKQILPWFGGSAAVWTTCMVFFQLVLLAGYAYSDLVTRKLDTRKQAIVHTVLLLASLAWLPIIPGEQWKPAAGAEPGTAILMLLAATIGLPYFLLSTTGPLVQAWFARSFPAGTVYRLFALSNFASLLSLIAYPPVIETTVTLKGQSWGWSVVYVLFVALCIASAWASAKHPLAAPSKAEVALGNESPPPTAKDYALWFALSALGSLMLLACTNHITQNVASVPFLWIVPLVLYLLSFILVFDVSGGRGRSGWYSRPLFVVPLLALLVGMSYGLYDRVSIHNVWISVALYCGGMFVACMFCHGEMAALRPSPRYLTRFYLMLSVGGAAGGLFVGLVAPNIFNAYLEMPYALVALAALLFIVSMGPKAPRKPLEFVIPVLAIAVTGVTAYYAYQYQYWLGRQALVLNRNFYGTLSVKQDDDPNAPGATRRLVHGMINHGSQLIDPEKRMTPASYFGPGSGIARALDFYSDRPRRVGVVGLGVGVFLGYGRKEDYFRIYELDPVVEKFAREQFWFLNGTPAKTDVIIGDGRLNLERDPPQQFDLLSLDAFSSDAIPMHLMTREALRMYRRHVKPDGVIVFNVTNRFIRLAPLLHEVAKAEGMTAILISDDPTEDIYSGTEYVLVTANKAFIEDKRFADAVKIEPIPGLKPWTDDFNNLFDVLK